MSENSKWFLVTLTPLETFFFGGERTFNPSEGESNYFVTSNYIPQQTTLLGLMRYLVLQKQGMLNRPSSETAHLIGNRGFTLDHRTDTLADYGLIHRISPVFIRYENPCEPIRNYLILAKDYSWNDSQHQLIPLELQRDYGKTKAAGSRIRYYAPWLLGYKSKNGLATVLVQGDGKRWHALEGGENPIFVADERVGIRKPRLKKRTRKEEDAYYRQKFFRLSKYFSFAFFAQLECDAQGRPPVQSSLTQVGAERSLFKVRITPANGERFETVFGTETFLLGRNQRNEYQVILTSDAFVKNESVLFDLIDFSIHSAVDFRYIETPTGAHVKYAQMSYQQSHNSLSKSGKYNLIERGSVFWFEEKNKQKVLDQLNIPRFQQIGYNTYIVYSKGAQL
jgi:CRISPR-associated protein Cmr3